MRRTIKWTLENSLTFLLVVLPASLRLPGLTPTKPAEEFSQRSWQARDGLPESSVYTIIQAPDGYLWIGTSGGLVRFDGWRFTLFNHSSDTAFQDDSVWSLAVGQDGTLWIGTEGGGLIRYSKGAFQHFGKETGLTNQFVRALYVDRNEGSLWVGTDDGVFKGNVEAGFRRLDATNGIPAMNVYSIVGRKDGARYVGGMGLLTVDKGRTRYFMSRKFSGDNFVDSICQTRDGTLWVGTFSVLRKLGLHDQGDIYSQAHVVPVPSAVNQINRSAAALASQWQSRLHYSAMVEASDGSLWIGTYGEGLLRWKDGNFKWYRAPQYLPDNHVSSVIEDAQKDIWVGTTNGLARLQPGQAIPVRLPGNTPVNVNSVANDGDTVLLSTLEGKMLRPVPGFLKGVSYPSLPDTIAVRTTFRDREGTLWIGTAGQGLFGCSRNGRIQHYAQADLVRAFAETPDGRLWIGTDGNLWTVRNGQITRFDAGYNRSFRTLVVDGRGVLWVGSDFGLLRIYDRQAVHEDALSPLGSLKIWSLLSDLEGAVWIGTRGSGLYLWESGHLHHYGSSNGFPTDSVYAILEDRFHQMWISGPSGVWSIDREALVAAADARSFAAAIHSYGGAAEEMNAEMNGGVQPAGVLTPSGDLWFASTNGVLKVHPILTSPPLPFPLVIEQIREDGSAIDIKDPVPIGANVQQTEIDYSAIRLDSPEHTRFRFKLDGLESRWTDAGSRRAAFYSHLPPGRYQFRVQAFDPGAPDRIIEAGIQVKSMPHFYQTMWFYTLCAALAFLFTGLAYLFHHRRLRERFELVLTERNRVAREVHDTIIQGCIGISTLLEAAHSTEETFPEKSRSLVHRARMQVIILVDQARNAVWNLRHEKQPPEQMFGSLLNKIVAEFQQEEKALISLHIDGALPSMSAIVCGSVASVVREALLNAIQHAHAGHILVSVHVSRPHAHNRSFG
jgi:ligand-binding sensor domain-containing protein